MTVEPEQHPSAPYFSESEQVEIKRNFLRFYEQLYHAEIDDGTNRSSEKPLHIKATRANWLGHFYEKLFNPLLESLSHTARLAALPRSPNQSSSPRAASTRLALSIDECMVEALELPDEKIAPTPQAVAQQLEQYNLNSYFAKLDNTLHVKYLQMAIRHRSTTMRPFEPRNAIERAADKWGAAQQVS